MLKTKLQLQVERTHDMAADILQYDRLMIDEPVFTLMDSLAEKDKCIEEGDTHFASAIMQWRTEYIMGLTLSWLRGMSINASYMAQHGVNMWQWDN